MFGIDHARPCFGARRGLKAKQRPRRRRTRDLEPLYGWGAGPLDQLCAMEPGLHRFVAEAPAHTRHYIAMALAGMAKHGHVTEAWLAGSLASSSRREVLQAIWGHDPGSTRALMRLGPDLLEPSTYEALGTVLGDEQRRRAYGDLRVPTERAIVRIADASADVVAAYRGRLIGTFGAAGILFLSEGIARLRPDLSAASIRRSLNALEKPSRIEHLFGRLIRNVQLPEPPWAGTSRIRALTTVPDLRAAGLRLENCLNTLPIWTEALTGKRAFYLVEECEFVIVALARHEVFGTWFVHSLAKRRNGQPSGQVKARIIATFAAAGFPYFDGAPIGTSLDGND
ncbi:MAG: hypothetical protein LCH88_21740 [Proteobacteria bacterium]|jgi:hypothetical protein|nr:hypothetical protein [Pseudomonadota bacterium]